MIFDKSHSAYHEFDKAVKGFPRSGGPTRLIVLNEQGLPILQFERGKGPSDEIDEKYVALGIRVIRNLFDLSDELEGKKPERIAMFFEDEVISFDWDRPFVFIISWPRDTIKLSNSMDSAYLRRLSRTLHEELT
ncbi:MAG: hypothetical protein P9L92_15695 [Candidatus Electryonea clarkiae]|nr:hypothetical protein [Candidatus Electryonea clarkiae]MDP8287268.1 hypothetical protein [Candidatus Electryonea clarkiae]